MMCLWEDGDERRPLHTAQGTRRYLYGPGSDHLRILTGKAVWADSNAEASRKARKPELLTIEEFQIDPVRPFLTDILRNMAAPWKRERRDNPVGQGIGFKPSSARQVASALLPGLAGSGT
jgi:hypothetical protein